MELLNLKDKKQCDSCYAEIEKDAKFCPKCGAEQQDAVEDDTVCQSVDVKEVEIVEDETKENLEEDSKNEEENN